MPTPNVPSNEPLNDDLLPEYDFDYSQARPNRFAERMTTDSIVVVLDPDVAEVFKTPEAVNRVLRALITTMPTPVKESN
ncbi:MAG: hypothetical protein R3264_19225 [Anaerolineae bacterium]|nr:hypothetical protein [Anaerolineae bacterium]